MISYLITDPSHYTRDPTTFRKRLLRSIHRHRPSLISLRDKANPKFKKIAKRLRDIEGVLIHQDFRLARRIGIRRVHLTSCQFDEIARLRRSGFYVIVSAHTLDELRLARRLRAASATLSPIFPSPGKGEPLGLRGLREAVNRSRFRILALGGIVGKREIGMIRRSKAAGFASIRYFI